MEVFCKKTLIAQNSIQEKKFSAAIILDFSNSIYKQSE